MKTLTKNEVFELINEEISFNLESVENSELSPDFKLGILQANLRFIKLSQRILQLK